MILSLVTLLGSSLIAVPESSCPPGSVISNHHEITLLGPRHAARGTRHAAHAETQDGTRAHVPAIAHLVPMVSWLYRCISHLISQENTFSVILDSVYGRPNMLLKFHSEIHLISPHDTHRLLSVDMFWRFCVDREWRCIDISSI